MTDRTNELEILISRILDNEATAAERRTLELHVRHDHDARALYAETSAIDCAAGQAMRSALGRIECAAARSSPLPLDACGLRAAPQERPRYSRARGAMLLFGRYATGAIAAAVGLLVWLNPPAHKTQDNQNTQEASSIGSWFAPISSLYEGFSPGAPDYERPNLSLRKTQREWLVIPSAQPDQFYLIQVDRSHTRLLNVQQDF